MGRIIVDDWDSTLEVGMVGFLVFRHDLNRGRTGFDLWHAPIRTNLSNTPILEGWAGTTNNTAFYADGVARVVQAYKNGNYRLQRVTDPAEVEAFLSSRGYQRGYEQHNTHGDLIAATLSKVEVPE